MFRSLVLAALVLTASATLADEATAIIGAQTFESIDRNGDRRISKTEAGAYKGIIDRFATLDQNGDGFVSKDEYEGRPVASR